MSKKAILVVAAVLALGLTAYPQALSFSFSSGVSFPKEDLFRDIYGRGTPLAVEVRIPIRRSFGLAAGFEYLSAKGTAVNISQGDVDFPVRFRMVSCPISLFLLYPTGKIAIWAAAGISFHSYKEEWEDLGLIHEGKKTKPFLSTGVEYEIVPRLSIRLSLRFQSITAERGPYLQRDVDLGGLAVLAGLSLRVL